MGTLFLKSFWVGGRDLSVGGNQLRQRIKAFHFGHEQVKLLDAPSSKSLPKSKPVRYSISKRKK
jgi:hypothetical protein